MIEKITFGTTNVTPKRILENSQSLTITFTSSMTYEEVRTLLSNKDNTSIVTYTRETEGQSPYTNDYVGYTVLQPITVGEGEYTIVLNQPNLQQKYDKLLEENESLKTSLAEEKAVNEQQDMCIVEAFQQIYSN